MFNKILKKIGGEQKNDASYAGMALPPISMDNYILLKDVNMDFSKINNDLLPQKLRYTMKRRISPYLTRIRTSPTYNRSGLYLLFRQIHNVPRASPSQQTSSPLPTQPASQISMFEINQEVIQRRLPNAHQPELNAFMNALSSYDIGGIFASLSQLSKIFLKILTESRKRGLKYHLETYFECLELALTFYTKTETLASLPLLKNAQAEYGYIVDRAQKHDVLLGNDERQKSIENGFVVGILHAYHIAKRSKTTKKFCPLISDLFLKTIEEYGIDVSKIVLKQEYLGLVLEELCKTKPISIDHKQEVHDTDNIVGDVPIDSYLDEFDTISFENLGKYITENKFTWNGKVPQDMKLFEFYDTLNEEDRKAFLNEYTQFNQTKQLHIEEYSRRITKNITTFEKQRTAGNKYALMERETIKTWVRTSSEYVNTILANNDPKDETETILCNFSPYLRVIKPETLISIMISVIVGECLFSDKHHAPVYRLRYIMREVYQKHIVVPNIPPQQQKVLFSTLSELNRDRLTVALLRILLSHARITIPNDKIHVLKSLIADNNDATPPEFINQMAGTTTYPAFAIMESTIDSDERSKRRKAPVIHPHPFLIQDLIHLSSGFYKQMSLPMLCPPKPWTKPDQGGYLLAQEKLVPIYDQIYQQYLQRAGMQGELDFVYSTLDQLGSVAWGFNPDMVGVFERVMEFENGILSIPARFGSRPPKTATLAEKQRYNDLKASRIQLQNLLDVVKMFTENGDMFYHSYFMDFRGRVYAMSMVSQYQLDIIRSLLMFWKGEKLGPRGFSWLKYALSSHYGNKGMTLDDAVEFCDQHMEDILDSASDPFGGKQWWMRGDDPFQLLTSCKEIKKILEWEKQGGKIEDYECRIPVTQDGSCNGLQHYAALGKDEIGAAAVNLLPLEQRKDVYVEVMNVVQSKIEAELESQVLDETQKQVAQTALNILSRGIVKRPIMTTVYGVTFHGAGNQIHAELNDLLEQAETNPVKWIENNYSPETLEMLKKHTMKISHYLGRHVLNSISDLFVSAKTIQDWLLANADRVLKSFDLQSVNHMLHNMTINPRPRPLFKNPKTYKPLTWTTITGFPVIQIYRTIFMTQPESEFLRICEKSNTISPIQKQKQRAGIAPNYIHSIDATHMHMTCDACFRNGVTFAGVHDAFWTYPSQVDLMSRLLREEFVRLHEIDLLLVMKQSMEALCHGSFQLVYFEKGECKELYEEVKKVRGRKKRDEYLYEELQEMSSEGGVDECEVYQLVKKYDPVLYFEYGNRMITEYSEQSRDKYRRPKGMRFIPVLVPVKILEVPKKGTLDITKVIDSKFFFA